MQWLKQYIFIFYILFNVFACSDQPNALTYTASGVSLTIPESWEFTSDSYYKGNRTISLLTGEFSGVSLTIFPEGAPDYKDINRNNFVKKRILNLVTSGVNKDNVIETHIPISRPPFVGEQVSVSYKLPIVSDMIIESYLLSLDKAKIIVIIQTEINDLPHVSNQIQGFLKSISYDSNLSDFDKDKIYIN